MIAHANKTEAGAARLLVILIFTGSKIIFMPTKWFFINPVISKYAFLLGYFNLFDDYTHIGSALYLTLWSLGSNF